MREKFFVFFQLEVELEEKLDYYLGARKRFICLTCFKSLKNLISETAAGLISLVLHL